MVPPLPFLGLAGRAELALADACGALELPQLLLAAARLSFPSVSALGPNPAVLMLLLSWRKGLGPRGWVGCLGPCTMTPGVMGYELGRKPGKRRDLTHLLHELALKVICHLLPQHWCNQSACEQVVLGEAGWAAP